MPPVRSLLAAALLVVLAGCGTPAGAAVSMDTGPSAFAEPVRDHQAHLRAHALRIGTGAFPAGLHAALRPHRVVLLGEIHGTREYPRLAGEMVRFYAAAHQPVMLVVELPRSEQAALDAFMKSGERADLEAIPFFRRAEQDGRSSTAIAELLQRVRKLPDVPVLAYDAEGEGQARETAMAENLAALLRAHPKRKAVVLTGNVHAMRQVGVPWDPALRPMAHELEQLAETPVKPAEIVAIKFWFGSGKAWMAGPNGPGPVELPKQDSAYTRAVAWSGYFAREPRRTEGFDAVLFQRTLTPSAPAVKSR